MRRTQKRHRVAALQDAAATPREPRTWRQLLECGDLAPLLDNLRSTLAARVAVTEAPRPMPTTLPTQFSHVSVVTKANVYFDGKVVSHTVLMPDGAKKTLGLIYPGSYHFNTGAPERMEIIAGRCRVNLDGAASTQNYVEGQHFDVPGKSGFTIDVAEGICEYICSFL